MNTLPPFPISPLDDGKPPHRVPLAAARVEADGEGWILRPCNGLLFARRERQNDAEWTFVAVKPLGEDLSAEDLTQHWKHALEHGKVARFVLFYARYIGRDFPLFFVKGGTGWMREFWNRDDFPFEWTLLDGGQGALTRPQEEFQWACPQVFSEHISWPLNNWDEDHPAESTFPDEPLHFLCGSREELERLCRLICWSDGLIAQTQTPIQLVIEAESGFTRARLSEISSASFDFFRTSAALQKAGEGDFEWYPDVPSPHL